MTAASRRQRAHDTETAIARWFTQNGWPFAEPVGAGRPGTDITGMPGLTVEVKARRDLNLTAWLRQADTTNGSLPLVIHRPDGYGPATLAAWPVTFRLEHATRLLRQAGYGDP